MPELELTKYANAVGLVYDLSLPVRYPLAAVWQVDGETVVTCAHSVILYTEILKALRVRFPTSGREYSIKSVVFHPKVDKTVLKAMAKHGLTDPVNGLPLQKHNVALLKLSPNANELSADEIKEINDSFERFVPEHEAGLGGSLAEIELPLVVQTITTVSYTHLKHCRQRRLELLTNSKLAHCHRHIELERSVICRLTLEALL